jgi:hypothetical protein
MIWLILSILSAIGIYIGIKKDEENIWGTSALSLFIFGCLTIIMVMSGGTDYPNYLQAQKKIQVLEKGIEDIRNASYKNKESSNIIISGNLENFKQSSNLSEYIRMVNEQKAKYSSYIFNSQYYEKSLMCNIFADGFFIDKRIHEIKIGE